MRKRFRILESKLGFRAEVNSRWMINQESIRDDWPDHWQPIGGDRETLKEAKADIQDWKDSIDTKVVHEE